MAFLKIKYFLHKLYHWEYWPQALVYAPIFPVYLYYSYRLGTPFFPITANPDMENGGYLMESKYTIYKNLPQALVPITLFVAPNLKLERIQEQMRKEKIDFPCICKPDVGGKGIGVEVINNVEQLTKYHTNIGANYLIQEKVEYANEVGIFYCRYPNEEKGKITGIVGKKDMQVTGDGKKTLQQLILEIPRFYFQKKYLFQKWKMDLNKIMEKGKTLTLSTIGNHSRGSEFIDLTNQNSKKLFETIDQISKAYNTFYFGRYDIMYNKWSDLENGINFSIIELNGSGSEPTHIYDAKKPLFNAWKIILKHWNIMYKIAKQNHRNHKPFISLADGLKIQKQYASYEKEVKKRVLI
jgi:hypothetical protein